MKLNIRDLMDNIEDSSVDLEESSVVSPERIKELTTMKINEYGIKPKRNSKKLITLLIAVAVVSAVGIAAYAGIKGGLESQTFGKSTWSPEMEKVLVQPDSGETVPERELISVQGYADSPEYQATGEWLSFEDSYDRDFSIANEYDAECKRTGVDVYGEKYPNYGIYSQEMADKVDEILAKYNLKLHTGMTDGNQDLLKERFGEIWTSDVTGAGYFYDDGSFQFDATYKNVEFQIRRCMRGYFDTVCINVGNINNFDQYSYVTKDGITVNIAMHPNGGAIISVDLEDSFISINVMNWDSDLNEVVHTREELEDLVDHINFAQL